MSPTEPSAAVGPCALVSDDRDACSGSAACSSKATKAPGIVFHIIEKGL